MCLYPKFVLNPKYKPNKKNRGVIPPVSDYRVLYVPIGCKQCMECKKQKAMNWKTRLLEDVKVNREATFVTLTFNKQAFETLAKQAPDIKGYTLDNWIATRAVRLFLERWRKEHKKSLRHWLVTELGHNGTENVHLHGIVWSKNVHKIRKHWQYGFVWCGTYVNERTVSYITKYVTKTDLKHKYYNPIILTSAGIGGNYVNSYNATNNKYVENKTREYYITANGTKLALPTYWRNKIYNEDERERLWLEKLDKCERFVLGERVDMAQGEENYWRAVEAARALNKRLGFRGGEIDYDEKDYEVKLREVNHKKRMGG